MAIAIERRRIVNPKLSPEFNRRRIETEIASTENSVIPLGIVSSMNGTLMAGASTALRKVLEAKGGPDLPADALVTDVVSHNELRSLDWRAFANNVAKLRLDEIHRLNKTPVEKLRRVDRDTPARPDEMLVLNERGELAVSRPYLRAAPPEETDLKLKQNCADEQARKAQRAADLARRRWNR